MTGAITGVAGIAYPSGASSLFSGVPIAQSLVFCMVFSRLNEYFV